MMKKMARFILWSVLAMALLIPATAQSSPPNTNVSLVTNGIYLVGDPVTIQFRNDTAGPVTLSGKANSIQCHRTFNILDSNNNIVQIARPYMACTMEYATLEVDAGETVTLGTWDQKAYLNSYRYDTCSAATGAYPSWCDGQQVPGGHYTVQADVYFGSSAIVLGGEMPAHKITTSFTITADAPVIFSDVPYSYWAYDHIMYLYNEGIAQGFGNGKFRPDWNITKAEMVKMAINAAEIPVNNYIQAPHPYKDVPSSHSLAYYIDTAKSRGLIPDEDYFHPEERATRFFTLQILMDALGIAPETGSGQMCGGIAGMVCPGNQVCIDNPNDSCDPENGGADCSGSCQCTAIGLCIQGYTWDTSSCSCVPNYELNAIGSFTDVSDPTQRAYADAAREQGIVSGYGDGTFGPNNPVRRSEMAKIIHNTLTANNDQAGYGTLSGYVSIGPICPVEGPGIECNPAPEFYTSHSVVAYKYHTRTEQTRTSVNVGGSYSMRLPAGSYSVTVEPGGMSEVPQQDVTIQAGQTSVLNFDVDTGIR